jgi:phosphoribosylanthranilate isomerase
LLLLRAPTEEGKSKLGMTALFKGCKLQCMGDYLRVKICGLMDEADAVKAAELGADWVGLNFYDESPRCITAEKARSIMRGLPQSAEPVGIVVPGKSPMCLGLAVKLRLPVIQLHGEVEPSLAIMLTGRHLRVIPAFSVAEERDLQKITSYLEEWQTRDDIPVTGSLPCTDGPSLESWAKKPQASLAAWMKQQRPKRILPPAILVDAHVPGQFGGTGKIAPWKLLADFQPRVPLILAGGLTPENVAEAVRIVRPYGVDVASGVEKSPGVKDPEKIKRFILNAREAAEK